MAQCCLCDERAAHFSTPDTLGDKPLARQTRSTSGRSLKSTTMLPTCKAHKHRKCMGSGALAEGVSFQRPGQRSGTGLDRFERASANAGGGGRGGRGPATRPSNEGRLSSVGPSCHVISCHITRRQGPPLSTRPPSMSISVYVLDSANSRMSSMQSTSNGPRPRPSPTSLSCGVLTAVQVM